MHTIMTPVLLLVTVLLAATAGLGGAEKVCIIGSGIGGASAAFFLKNYSTKPIDIEIYERNDRVGGRLAQVQLGDDKFEAGGSIIAAGNRHMVQFTELLGLTQSSDSGDDSFGIWDGREIFFQTSQSGGSYISQKLTRIWNSFLLLWRYGSSLFKMDSYVSELLDTWDQLYSEERPAYATVDDLLKSIDLYNLTQHTLEQDLIESGFSSRFIDEIATLTVRINYGQSVSITGLAGAVALAGSGDNLWKVKEGNWKVPEGLIKYTNSSLHLKEEVVSVTCDAEGSYEVGLRSNQSSKCDAVIIATPLDEVNISFTPPIDIPSRSLQHTYTTFVKGLINSQYFGAASHVDLPALIATVEDPHLLFTSISVLKSYTDELEKVYKVFSRALLTDADLDKLFTIRKQTVQFDWGAYPHYTTPEKFAPILLDDSHLYYVNTFESAASAMEASTVAAQNVARLLLSRMSGGILACPTQPQPMHSEL